MARVPLINQGYFVFSNSWFDSSGWFKHYHGINSERHCVLCELGVSKRSAAMKASSALFRVPLPLTASERVQRHRVSIDSSEPSPDVSKPVPSSRGKMLNSLNGKQPWKKAWRR